MEPGGQGGADHRVLAAADLEVQGHLFARAGEPEGDHHDRSVAHDHAIEHEPEEGRFRQVSLPQFNDPGRRGLDPVARGGRFAHDPFAGPRLAAGAHAGPERRDHCGRVVAGPSHRGVARQHVLALRAVSHLPAHAGS